MKKKIISILLTIVMMALMVTPMTVFGFEVPPVQPRPVTELQGSVTNILGVIQWIGFIVGIGMVIYIGVKYITAGAGGKAEVKSTMVPWLVGAACVALAPTIASAIFSMFQEG